MKLFFLVVFAFLLSSCIISINTNSYEFLNDTSKQIIKPFEKSFSYKKSYDGKNLTLFEINSMNINYITNNNEYTWLHIWNPYCHNDHCVNIKPFEEIANKYSLNGLNLIMASSTYDLKQIKNTIDVSGFEQKVYVLENDYYGGKLKQIRNKLNEDLNPEDTLKNTFYSDYLFKKDSLIFTGHSINDSIVESLLL